jgi:hypothetical protein
MDNMYNWVVVKLPDEEVKTWFEANNIIFEKCELFLDFCLSLLYYIEGTYLGDYDVSNMMSIKFEQENVNSHFKWCWNQTLKDFQKERIFFAKDGEHYEFFKEFFIDTFYNQELKLVKDSINEYFTEIFDWDIPFTKSDLKFITDVYKVLDKNMVKVS